MARRKKYRTTTIAGLLFLATSIACCGMFSRLIGISPESRQNAPGSLIERSKATPAPAKPNSTPLRQNPYTYKPPEVAQLPASEAIGQIVPSSAAAVEKKATAEGQPELRTWTANQGKHSTLATFAGFAEGRVRLTKTDQKTSEVPLAKLSAGDRDYVKGLLRVDPLANVVIGKVINVTNGDTFELQDEENHRFSIRLEGIDAPEMGDKWHSASKRSLSTAILGKTPWVEWRQSEANGELQGRVYLDGRDINLDMVANGFARHLENDPDQRLANAEQVARHGKLGIWHESREDNR